MALNATPIAALSTQPIRRHRWAVTLARRATRRLPWVLASLWLGVAMADPPDCAAPGGAPAMAPSAAESAALADWTRTLQQRTATDAARLEARLRRAELYRMLGRYREAAADLEAVLRTTTSQAEALPRALALTSLGQVLVAQQRTVEGERRLREGLALARQGGDPALIANAANALGALVQQNGDGAAAAHLWREALAAARQAADPGLLASVQLNLAQVTAGTAALDALQQASAAIDQVSDPGERASLLLALAARALDLGDAARPLATASLETAAAVGRRNGLGRVQTQALDQAGALALADGDSDRAVSLTTAAIAAAPLDAYDLRYPLEWRLGRLLSAAGDRMRAIEAYRRAVGHLQQIRAEIPVEYAEGRSSFRDTLGPLYLGLADLLLQEAPQTEGAAQQSLLREARDTVEQLKLDELRDYFRDACILPLRESVETLSARAAVFYPILFEDRLELLVGIGARLYQASLPVTGAEVGDTAALLALKLRYEQPADEESAQLHDWLIGPIEPWLQAQGVETLVFVPDGPLRAVPLAVLRRNGQYLVERYAIATEPGLKLLQPEPIAGTAMTTLLAGLSRPGPVVDDLPGWWVNALVAQNRQLGRGLTTDDRRGATVSAGGGAGGAGGAADPVSRAARAERIAALALPGVAAEIEQLSHLVQGRSLRDEAFVLQRFITEIEEQPYRVVHIASHGLFQGPPEENFIVTYDRKLDMKTLAAILKPKELAERPIELLVLSACQTAEGDDRTPLGLSGVAIQSGARGAIGSLWPVSDAATQVLMRAFYAHLKRPGATKGQALQAAQKALIASGTHNQPSDWAAFILVGNWL